MNFSIPKPSAFSVFTVALFLAVTQSPVQKWASAKQVYDMNLQQIEAALPMSAITPVPAVYKPVLLPKRKPPVPQKSLKGVKNLTQAIAYLNK